MINEKVNRVLDYFTGDMCYNDEINPGCEPYLMVYNANAAFETEECPHSHCYYYNYYIYVMMIKERVLYET